MKNAKSEAGVPHSKKEMNHHPLHAKVLKEQAIVDAQRAKEVAVIAAEQRVEVARQQQLEAEQKKLAALEYKQEQILRGEGDGERCPRHPPSFSHPRRRRQLSLPVAAPIRGECHA